MLCEEGKPVTHIVVLLDGKIGVCRQEDDFAQQMQGQKSPTPKFMANSNQSEFSPSKQSSKER